MKKLLLLFIPLVFFFSCEDPATGYNCAESGCVESASAESGYYLNLEDCESNCNCSCGIVTEEVYVEADAGDYLIDVDDLDGDGDNTDVIVVGDHPGYTYHNVQNNCSGNIGSSCLGGPVGAVVCMEYQCTWTLTPYFDVNIGDWVEEYMLSTAEQIPFN